MRHIEAFKRGDTDSQRAAEIRAQDESDGPMHTEVAAFRYRLLVTGRRWNDAIAVSL
jgi:hypothetical protein